MADNPQRIAIVGPCGSGKSTLARNLAKEGVVARQIAQEHSYVPEMWQVITNPDILIYLDATFPVCTERKSFHWREEEYQEQVRRLLHARNHCQIYVDTSELSEQTTLERVLRRLKDYL